MNKIKDIALSWWRAANPTEKQTELAQERLEICNGCEKKQESIVFGYVCGQCGCPLGKKIFSEVEQPCPLSKW